MLNTYTYVTRSVILLAAVSALCGCGGGSGNRTLAVSSFTIRRLTTTETNSMAADINDSGQIVGHEGEDAMLWDAAGNATILSKLPTVRAVATAESINDSGTIVGYMWDLATQSRGAVWNPDNTYTLLEPRIRNSWSRATIVSPRGQIVGMAFGDDVLWHSADAQYISYEIRSDSILLADINDQGWAVGSSAFTMRWSATVWGSDGKVLRYLPPLPGDSSSFASAVNENGIVAGRSVGPDHATAVVWPVLGGRPSRLSALPGYRECCPTDINDLGQVVGYALRGDGPFCECVAVFWNPDGSIVSLPTLPGSSMSKAMAINNSGQIVGWSGNGDVVEDTWRAVIWESSR